MTPTRTHISRPTAFTASLRAIVGAAGLSIAAAGRACEVRPRTFQDWWYGYRTPAPHVQKLILERLQNSIKNKP